MDSLKTKLAVKYILRWVIYTLLGGFGIFCAYHAVDMAIKMNRTHLECGTVVSKFSDEVAMKHGTSTELILIVDWDGRGKDDINVAASTYHDTKVGKRICFRETDAYRIDGIVLLWAYLGAWEIVCGVIWVIVMWCKWIFKNESNENK